MLAKDFGGRAGSIAVNFLNPLTLFWMIGPVVLMAIFSYATAAVLAMQISRGSMSYSSSGLIAFLWLLLISFQVGCYAIPASQGELSRSDRWRDSYRRSSGVYSFAFRLAMCCVMAGGVLLCALYLLSLFSGSSHSLGLDLSSLIANPFFWISMGALGPALIFCTVFFIQISVVVALTAETFIEVFNPALWLEPIRFRFADLLVYCVLLSGTTTVLFGLYSLPIRLMSHWTFGSSGGFGTFVMSIISLFPVVICLSLLGRLGGAFVSTNYYSEDEDSSHSEVTASDGLSIAHPLLEIPAPAPVRFVEIKAKIAGVDETKLGQALLALELELSESLGDPAKTLELALLRKRAGHKSAALSHVRNVLKQALNHDEGGFATDVVREFWDERGQLLTDPILLEKIGRLLLELPDFVQAAWCLNAAASLSKDELRAQKAMLEVAHRAREAGQLKVSLQLYEFVIKKYPETSFRVFVESTIELLRHQV